MKLLGDKWSFFSFSEYQISIMTHGSAVPQLHIYQSLHVFGSSIPVMGE